MQRILIAALVCLAGGCSPVSGQSAPELQEYLDALGPYVFKSGVYANQDAWIIDVRIDGLCRSPERAATDLSGQPLPVRRGVWVTALPAYVPRSYADGGTGDFNLYILAFSRKRAVGRGFLELALRLESVGVMRVTHQYGATKCVFLDAATFGMHMLIVPVVDPQEQYVLIGSVERRTR